MRSIFQQQWARKMLTNLPISGKTQDCPTNGKGLSNGPCPKGADVKKFAIPHYSICSLPLLCPNPPKARWRGAQETVKVNLSKGGSTQSPKDEEMAQCASARQKTQQGTVNSTVAHRTANTCVPSPLPGETLRHVLATAKSLPAICSFSFNESVE